MCSIYMIYSLINYAFLIRSKDTIIFLNLRDIWRFAFYFVREQAKQKRGVCVFACVRVHVRVRGKRMLFTYVVDTG